MRTRNILISAGLAAGLVAVSVFPASAYPWHRGGYYHRGGPGLIGGVIVGAATIATLPFAILGDALSPGPAYPPRAYGPPPQAYGPPPPPPGYYGRYYGRPRGYYYPY